jgi:hypothetical protein
MSSELEDSEEVTDLETLNQRVPEPAMSSELEDSEEGSPLVTCVSNRKASSDTTSTKHWEPISETEISNDASASFATEEAKSVVDSLIPEFKNETKKSLNQAEILIDVTERTHFRHKNNRKQNSRFEFFEEKLKPRKHFSGKQRTHTVKNTVMSTSNRSVIFLGKTFAGSVHDYNMLKQELSPKKPWFSKVLACVDLGYQGIKTDYSNAHNISIPNKKPRKSKANPNPSLTKQQKRENKKMGRRRVFVEHAIGGMKAFHILSTRFRNRSKNLADEAAFLVAGLWNLKISSHFNRL